MQESIEWKVPYYKGQSSEKRKSEDVSQNPFPWTSSYADSVTISLHNSQTFFLLLIFRLE